MIGAVSADNLLVLFLCWELTSLTSFFLVGFNHTSEQARTAAQGPAGLILVGKKPEQIRTCGRGNSGVMLLEPQRHRERASRGPAGPADALAGDDGQRTLRRDERRAPSRHLDQSGHDTPGNRFLTNLTL